MIRPLSCALGVLLASTSLAAASECSVAHSRYVGWEPAVYIQQTGIADRWGEKYGVDLEFVYINDYIESINQFTNGAFVGVTATTLDTLTIPAVSGVDTTVLVIGDYSNGNDALLVNDPAGSVTSVADLVGQEVMLVELSVSHYLLLRALEEAGLAPNAVSVVHTSDADIGAAFATGGPGTAAVTWNPIVMTALDTVPGAVSVFDSSRTPGEILDAIVVATDTSDACKRAITGAWYEAMSVISGTDQAAADAIALMAEEASGGSIEDPSDWFLAQLSTTEMFYDPADAAFVARSADLQSDTQRVYDFALDLELLTAPVGIVFPDGTVIGDPDNVTLRFDATYMEAAAAGEL